MGQRFLIFALSRGLSVFGDMAAMSALAVHVFAETSSGLALSGLFVARVVPRVFGAFAGTLSDRLDLRRLLIICDVLSGALFAVMAVAQPSYWVLLALVLVAESVATVALPGSRTLVARSLPPERMGRANAVLMAATAMGFASGAGFGGLAAGLWGYQYALLANAGTFVVSALLLTLVPRVPPAPTTSSTVDGVRALLADREMVVVAVGMVGVALAAAMDRPALVALTQGELDAGGLGYGIALGAISIGVLAAAAFGGKQLFLTGILLQAAGHLLFGLAPWIALVAAAALVAGYGNGLENVSGTTLLQRAAPAGATGTVMGAVVSATFLADALGSLIGGPLVDLLGPRPVFWVASVLMVVCALVAKTSLQRRACKG
ncbi:MFS transporter [Allokutzneria oryzae]|uniref:MFS transporter n=1 Tax=Allokutzneria oryzae TaxID=1378989 RepID=A0ABV5ZRX3_9PSEU